MLLIFFLIVQSYVHVSMVVFLFWANFCNIGATNPYNDQNDRPKNIPKIPPTSDMKVVIVYLGDSSTLIIVSLKVWWFQKVFLIWPQPQIKNQIPVLQLFNQSKMLRDSNLGHFLRMGKYLRKRPLMPFHVFWPFLTYLPTYLALQISIGWLSVISSVIHLALKGFYL